VAEGVKGAVNRRWTDAAKNCNDKMHEKMRRVWRKERIRPMRQCFNVLSLI